MAQNLAYADSMADKPASRPIAKALPHPSGNGYAGQFAVPGLVPDYVRHENKIIRFEDPITAELGALRAMRSMLASRMVDRSHRADTIRRMTGAELAVALAEAELTPTEFAELYGVPQKRVMSWLNGEMDIPHSAHVLVRLLGYEENYKEARLLTDRAQGLRSD